MSDAKQRLRDAMARRDESYEDREAREAHERDEATAFFERVIVPGFEAAAAEINQQAEDNQGRREPPADAEASLTHDTYDGKVMELAVRRGGYVDFWFRGWMDLRAGSAKWTYRRNPRIKTDGTTTSQGTERELNWPVAVGETTQEQVRDDLLDRYAKVVEARNRRRR